MTTHIKKTFLSAAIAAFASNVVLAQTEKQTSFTGFGLGATISSIQNSMEVTSGLSDFAATSSEAAIVASYGYPMGKDWIGMLGLAVGAKNSDYGSYTSNTSTNKATARNHIAVSFAPGYRIGNSSLVYAKLGLHQMDVNYTSSTGFDITKTHQGTGFGIGYAMSLTSSLELNMEYESIGFDAQNTASTSQSKPKQGNLSVGLTYRF